jgi:hypothetical protein
VEPEPRGSREPARGRAARPRRALEPRAVGGRRRPLRLLLVLAGRARETRRPPTRA